MLARAAELCAAQATVLSVVVPLGASQTADGCCGIQGDHWTTLMEDHAQADLQAAVRRLGDAGCRVSRAAVRGGERDVDIVLAAADDWSCDAVLVATRRRRWSANGVSRASVSALRGATRRRIIAVSA